MKDEEMDEEEMSIDNELLEEYLKDESKYLIEDNEGNLINITKKIKEAYLAGLKAGRPKWHKVADGDLPKDRCNVYVVYLNGSNEIEKTIASFRHKFWVFDGHKTECEVIAWCEIPKYTEE